MPWWTKGLTCVHIVARDSEWTPVIPMAVELYCGNAAISFALQSQMVGVFKPWDVDYGEQYDVLKGENILALNKVTEEQQAMLWWLATPCQSCSVAKTPAVRSLEEPLGRTCNSLDDQALVEQGNRLLQNTAERLEYCDKHRQMCVIENPWPCYSWIHPDIKRVVDNPNFALTVIRQDHYDAPWIKHTALLHNTPSLHLAAIGVEGMQRTHMLRGKVWHDGEHVYKTSLAESYVPRMAMEIGKILAQAFWKNWDRKKAGLPVLKANKLYDENLRHMKALPLMVQEWTECPDQRQPFVPNGGGAPKGLSQMEHYAWACPQAHEFDLAQPDGYDAQLEKNIVREMNTDTSEWLEIDQERESMVGELILMAAKLETERSKWWQSLHPDVQPVLKTVHYPLQKLLMDKM